MEKYVDEMEQIVIPGAGFDLIALHLTKGKKVKVFELDQVKTLNVSDINTVMKPLRSKGLCDIGADAVGHI